MRTLAILAATALILATAGCGSRKPEPSATQSSPSTGAVEGTLTPRPGLTDAGNGSKRAVGILVHRDIEGGFWAIVDATSAEQAKEATVVVVLVAPNHMIARGLEGHYVEAVGDLRTGVSIRMAGPELKATTLGPVRRR